MDSFGCAILSSLHQKVKFILEKKLMSLMAKEDILVPPSNMVPLLSHNRWTRPHSVEFFLNQLHI